MPPRLLVRSFGTLVFAGVAFLIVWRLVTGLEYGHTVGVSDLPLLATSVGMISVCVLTYGLVACSLLRWLTRDDKPRPGQLRLFLFAWLMRYIPGTVPYHAYRILLADKLGATKTAVAGGLLYENILLLGAAGVVGMAGLLIGLSLDSSSYLPYLAVGLLIACPTALLQPRILLPVSSQLLRLVRRSPLDPAFVLSTRRSLAIFGVYCLTHCLQGFAFCLVVVAVSDSVPNLPLVVGAYVLAAGLGMLALFAPSGLGVREGVIVALLAGAMPAEQALLAAGLVRLVSILADLVPAGLAGAIDWAASIFQPSRQKQMVRR